jgi:hypothetical protein
MSSGTIDYKKKYYSLRSRYISAIDLAFRSGYEQGYTDGTQQQQQQVMAGMQGMGAPQGGEGQPQGAPEGAPEGAPQGGGEMDQYIQTLEELVSKGEPSMDDLKKSIQDMKMAQMSKRVASSGYKNLNHKAKQAVSMQEKIVNDLMTKWEEQEKTTAQTLTRLVSTEALIRGK